jgi:hypothetical protein
MKFVIERNNNQYGRDYDGEPFESYPYPKVGLFEFIDSSEVLLLREYF